MNQAHHTKLRAAGWRYDPLSDRYSAPGRAMDGTQKMYTHSEAWDAYEASLAKEKQTLAKDEKAAT